MFKAAVDECAERLTPLIGADLRALLYPEEGAGVDAADRLKQTRFTQPALFAIEYALARLWMHWGVRPAAMIGHSIGEYVAACLAGVFSLEDALVLVAARGPPLVDALPGGAMLAVPLPEAQLQPWLGDVSLAAVNGPSLCVVSGTVDAVADLERRLSAREISSHRIHTSHAFHSRMMEPAVAAFRDELERIDRRAPGTPFISNVTGTWITAEQATSVDYWTQHLLQPVRFADGIGELAKDPRRVFLEVGPSRTLSTLARQHTAMGPDRLVLPMLRHAQQAEPDAACVMSAVGRLWAGGVSVDWRAFYAEERRRRVILPTYPFERKRYWLDVKAFGAPAPVPERQRAELADWFYAPVWTRSAAPPARADAGAAPRRRWLVLADEAGVAAQAIDRLTQDGHDVTVVEIGARFVEVGERRFAMNPGSREDYRALFNRLKDAGRLPAVIAHFWLMTGEALVESDASDVYQQRGFFSLLHLAQALGETGGTAPVRLGVVTSDLVVVTGDEPLIPSKATVMGPLRVIPQEYPNVSCHAVDVSGAEWRTPDGRWIADLLAEIAGPDASAIVAHRGGERWVPRLEPARFDAVTPDVSTRLRDGGVYLITGGLGGVGLTLAEFLGRTVNARLVLTGRSGLPGREEWAGYLASHGDADRVGRQMRSVEAIERTGAEVLVCAADAADPRQMQAAVDAARERWGRLDGVIHAAGVPGGGVIQLKTVEAAARVLAPKVAGTQALARALEATPLDFFVLCSSNTALFGGGGQVDYCAANAYLDAFARDYARRTGTFTVSIGWDAWREVGMAVETAVPGGLARDRNAMLQRGISPAEGADAFARVLARSTSPYVAISTAPLRAADGPPQALPPVDGAKASEAELAASGHSRPDLDIAYAAPVDEIERTIARVWQQVLGIDQIGRDDNFFDLGGHSLLLVQAHAALAETLGRRLPVTDLFQFPSISALAEHLGGAKRAFAVAPSAPVDRSDRAANAIAIVGMAGRFPGAPDLEAFWRNLSGGVESIETLSDDELRQHGVPEQWLQHPQYVKAASTIDGIDLFDAGFFGYSPREAELIEPQQRLFLECASAALEDAGYDAKRYAGRIGVYAGAGTNEYVRNIVSNADLLRAVGALQIATSNKTDYLPTRVSYKLNLRGPSLNVQTACSTSLVAVHQACRSLVDGECEMALAGGVTINVPGRIGYLYVEDNIVSPDGHCRAFDARAQGTVMGSGLGVVVLKRLADALADGDTIHAVIRGTAINNDGSFKVGYTAPSVEGQAAVIAQAHAAAGVAPADDLVRGNARDGDHAR